MFIGKACIRDRRSRRLKDTLFTKIQSTTIYITFVFCFSLRTLVLWPRGLGLEVWDRRG